MLKCLIVFQVLDRLFEFVFAEGIIFPWNFLIISALYAGLPCRSGLLGTQLFIEVAEGFPFCSPKIRTWNMRQWTLPTTKWTLNEDLWFQVSSSSMKGRKGNRNLDGGWTKTFLFFPRKLEEIIQIWRAYVSNGLVQAPARHPVNIILTFSDDICWVSSLMHNWFGTGYSQIVQCSGGSSWPIRFEKCQDPAIILMHPTWIPKNWGFSVDPLFQECFFSPTMTTGSVLNFVLWLQVFSTWD